MRIVRRGSPRTDGEGLRLDCYCADPERCHRTVLRDLLRECGAIIE
jgi:hypothetical protein